MTAPLFPPPGAVASLYAGPVMHQRLKPFGHRFRYDVAAILVDLDRLDELPRLSPLISHNRFNLFSIHDRDLGAADATAPAEHAEALLREAGLQIEGGRNLLLTYPRILGYVFNPLSIYWRYDRSGVLRAVIYEVRNTFGERHAYVAPVAPGELGPAGLTQSRDKRFHVSPFLGMALRYQFRLRPPGETIALRILETDGEGPILAATFFGRRIALTSASLLRSAIRLPFLMLTVIAAIHWEALKLWLKGARYHARPAPPAPASFGDEGGLTHDPRLLRAAGGRR
jgi:DUF1365 family protein